MFDFNLQLSKKSDSENVLISQPIYYYIVFSIILVTILSTIILYGSSPLSIILVITSFIALTYKERWNFNRESETITFQMGVGFIYHTNTFKFKDIELIEKSLFIKGKKDNSNLDKKLPFYMSKYHSLKIYFKNGKYFTILTVKDYKKETLDIIAAEVSNITKKIIN
ncbi:MAG: hypothetical protein B6229_06070 [Spirochaetaceae bacterium 4572_7]|nr:MAG: hypothetical protein B6229_06070 [Spirochaetaceae bacterium 4572_7]